MRKQKRLILQKIPKGFKLAFGTFVEHKVTSQHTRKNKIVCENSPTPVRFGEGQFRDV